MAAPVKQYFDTLASKNLHQLRRKATYASSMDFLDADTLCDESPNKNDQKQPFYNIFMSKDRLFLQEIEKKIHEKHYKKSSKKAKSFEVFSQADSLMKNETKTKENPRLLRKNDNSFTILPRNSTEIAGLKLLQRKKSTVFVKNTIKKQTLRPFLNSFEDFLDNLNIRDDDKQLIGRNNLVFKTRRKSACDLAVSGGICKKLEKNSYFLTIREKKINVFNLLILQGKKEYVFGENRPKNLLMKKSTFNQKIRRVLNNCRTQENQKEIHVIQSKNDVIVHDSKINFIKKSSSLDISFGNHDFLRKIQRNLEKNEKTEKKINEKTKNPLINQWKSKNFSQILGKRDHSSDITKENDENSSKNMQEAVNLTISNSIANCRIRKLFCSFDKSSEISNEYLNSPMNSSKKTTEIHKKIESNEYKSYKLEGFKRFLMKKTEKKNKENMIKSPIENTAKNIINNQESYSCYFLKENYHLSGKKTKKKLFNSHSVIRNQDFS